MREGFRASMAWLHTWTGLIVGWVLFFVFVTGGAGYFNTEITRWMQPELPLQPAPQHYDKAALVSLGLKRLEQVAPQAQSWSITLPHQDQISRSWEGFGVSWETLPLLPGSEHGVRGAEKIDPETGGHPAMGRPPRVTGGGGLLYRMHYALRYIDFAVAIRLIGVCTLLLLIALISGIITHKRIFADFFTFRPGKGQRSWLDAHNVLGVMSLPFLLIISFTGLLFFDGTYMPASIAAVYGTDDHARSRHVMELNGVNNGYGYVTTKAGKPVTPPTAPIGPMLQAAETAWGAGQIRSVAVMQQPGTGPFVEVNRLNGGVLRVYDGDSLRFNARTGAPLPSKPGTAAALQMHQTLLALHEGRYAPIWQRWLYFVLSLLGCGAIATGLVLWTVKRRRRHESRRAAFGIRLVEALNAGTIAGLPAGIAAYFWANRLLPLDLGNRANWEANFIFLIWGEAVLYACARDTRKAWVELLWLASGAFALLPLVNAVTTDKNLIVTLRAQDWVLAGFDLTMFALGLAFAFMAVKVRQVWSGKNAPSAKLGMPSAKVA